MAAPAGDPQVRGERPVQFLAFFSSLVKTPSVCRRVPWRGFEVVPLGPTSRRG